MAITPYTQKRQAQDRGPQKSGDYNARVEENYRDLVYLYNGMAQAQVDIDSFFSSLYKQILSMSNRVDELDDRISALEMAQENLVFYSQEQIDNARFIGTPYEIPMVDQCSFHTAYNVMTLPYVADSSLSKIRYINDDGTFNVANGLEVLIAPIVSTADNTNAVVQTSSPYDALQAKPGRVWERDVLAPSSNVNGAQCYLYIRIPNELSVTGNTNGVMMKPFPIFGVDILEMSYSTNPNVALNEASSWTVFNDNDWYINNSDAVGHVPPGAWSGDEMVDAGPTIFYFEPKPISAIRIKLRQNAYMMQGSRYMYSYGLSNLDVRFDKFLATGKSIIRLDAPSGDVINSVQSVVPYIWNVSQANLDNVFDYRVIWETAPNSGSYTLSPVSSSQRVWLEITLTQPVSGYTPVLSSVIANYT